MKVQMVFVTTLVLSSALLALASQTSAGNPVHEVTALLEKMKAKMEADAKTEQKSYDKYACWCEDAMGRKADDIDKAKARISALIELVARTSGEVGVAEADNGRNKKDIVDIQAAIKVAVDLREKEHQKFLDGRNEAEQYMGACEAAINILSKATNANSGFLANLQEAQVVSAAAFLKGAVKGAMELGGVSAEDLDTVRRFAEAPEEFLRRQRSSSLLQQGGLVAALQLDGNPFGSYSPGSSQVQGILKEMYDNYARSLERTGGEEAEAKKSHLQLVGTKEAELRLIVEDLRRVNLRLAEVTALRARYREELDALRQQLKADMKFFDQAKKTCREKAILWSQRCELRTGEILGIDKALAILTAPEAQATFQKASTTLLQQGELIQLSSRSSLSSRVAGIYSRLKALATRYDNLALAQIAVMVKTRGSFDRVIALIDQMIELLQREARSDVEHRDRCQTGISKNKHDTEDTHVAIARAQEELGIAKNKAKTAQQDLNALESEIQQTEAGVKDREDLRNQERAEFKQALKVDANSAELLGKAIVALSSWYKAHEKDVAVLQKKQEPEHAEPEYTSDPDKAPETTFDGEYKSMSGGASGIISILGLLKEDFENEMKTGRDNDAKAQIKYGEDMAAMKDTLDSQVETKVTLAQALIDLKSKVVDLGELVDWKSADKVQLQRMRKALEDGCSWVETDFESRSEKRQTEIDGLTDAKSSLAASE